MTDPFTDLEINCHAQLWILEALRKRNPEAKIIYAGTRQIYGRPQRLPVVFYRQEAQAVLSPLSGACPSH
jgi:GDP-D-mannose dehydratase